MKVPQLCELNRSFTEGSILGKTATPLSLPFRVVRVVRGLAPWRFRVTAALPLAVLQFKVMLTLRFLIGVRFTELKFGIECSQV
ncbi:MAG: hypothetical protein WCS94_22940, partial [Verrucomicrobiota bacterium]